MRSEQFHPTNQKHRSSLLLPNAHTKDIQTLDSQTLLASYPINTLINLNEQRRSISNKEPGSIAFHGLIPCAHLTTAIPYR